MEIRDPIHGPITVDEIETAVIHSPWFQRLRDIKQLGFSELTFPGASHTRYLHSLGAMHLAGLAFDAIFRDADWLPAADRTRLRQTVRLATLCHDLGHPPLSHTSEVLLPTVREVDVPHLNSAQLDEQATHEHFTLKLLLDSGLTEVLRRHGVEPLHIASLLSDEVVGEPAAFLVGGRDLHNVLAALTSSELDVDRMDYLLRDSYFTGVSYGRFDVDWLLSHLTWHEVDGRLHLALHERALFSFDDFLLSRHHMFLMVYFHKKSVCYDHMLRHFYEDFPDAVRATASPTDYLELTDPAVWRALRAHEQVSPWAAGILGRRPLKLLAESTPAGRREPLGPLETRLVEAGIPHLRITSKGALSKYQVGELRCPIYVRKAPAVGAPYHLPLQRATRLYERYADAIVLERLYVAHDAVAQAGAWLEELRTAEAAAGELID